MQLHRLYCQLQLLHLQESSICCAMRPSLSSHDNFGKAAPQHGARRLGGCWHCTEGGLHYLQFCKTLLVGLPFACTFSCRQEKCFTMKKKTTTSFAQPTSVIAHQHSLSNSQLLSVIHLCQANFRQTWSVSTLSPSKGWSKRNTQVTSAQIHHQNRVSEQKKKEHLASTKTNEQARNLTKLS